MEDMSLAEAWEEILSFGAPVWAGVFAAILVFIIEAILAKKEIILASHEKKIERAKKAGHVVTGIRTNCSYDDRYSGNKEVTDRMYTAIYKYSINGYEGKKHVISDSFEPPRSISLYYIDSPKKVFSEYDKAPFGCLMGFVLYLIPILVAVAVMKLMGYNIET